MTTLTMRLVKGDFIVTGPDVEPMKFKSRARGARTGVRRTIPARRSPRSVPAASARHPRNYPSDRAGDMSGCSARPLPASRTEHATKSARAIRNLGHAVGDHRGGRPCPDHHHRRVVCHSMSYWASANPRLGNSPTLELVSTSEMKH